MVRISVITCTYNAADVLQRTLDSVAAQSYTGVEHVIVDGASKDATMSIVSNYQSLINDNGKETSLVVVSERDKGLYDAMNKGIGLATGDYLVFLNAGDRFASSSTLEEIAKQLEGIADKAQLPGVLYGNTDIVDDKGVNLGPRRLQPPERLTWRSFRNGMLVCHQAFYARTDIAKLTPYNTEYRLSADVDWCIRVMKRTEEMGLRLHNTHLVLCHYLAGGMSVQNHRASLMERFRIMTRHYGLLTTVLMHVWFVFRKK